MNTETNFIFDPCLGYQTTPQVCHQIQDPDILKLCQQNHLRTDYIAYTTPEEVTNDAFENKPYIEFNNHKIDRDLVSHRAEHFGSDVAIVALYLDEQKYHIKQDLKNPDLAPQMSFSANKGVPVLAEAMVKIRPAIEKHFEQMQNLKTNHPGFPTFQELANNSCHEFRDDLKDLQLETMALQVSHQKCLGHQIMKDDLRFDKDRRKKAREDVASYEEYYRNHPDFKKCLAGATIDRKGKGYRVSVAAYHKNDFASCDHCELILKNAPQKIPMPDALKQLENHWAQAGLDPSQIWNKYQSLMGANLSEKITSSPILFEKLSKAYFAVCNHLGQAIQNRSLHSYPYGELIEKMTFSTLKMTQQDAAELFIELSKNATLTDFREKKIKKCINHQEFALQFANSRKERKALDKISTQVADRFKEAPGIDPSSVSTKSIEYKEGKKKLHNLYVLYKHEDNNETCSRFCNITKHIPFQKTAAQELGEVKEILKDQNVNFQEELSKLTQLTAGSNLEIVPDEPSSSKTQGNVSKTQSYSSKDYENIVNTLEQETALNPTNLNGSINEDLTLLALEKSNSVPTNLKEFHNLDDALKRVPFEFDTDGLPCAEPQPYYKPSQIATFENKRSAHGNSLFVNGIMTTYEEACQTALAISEMQGGNKTDLIYNSTLGLRRDLKKQSYINKGYLVPAAKLLKGHILNYFENADPHKILHINAHSQGGAILNSILSEIPPELRERMVIDTYGTAGFIDKEMVGEVRNIWHPNDLTSKFADLKGWEKAKKDGTLVVLENDGKSPLEAHGLMGGYKKRFRLNNEAFAQGEF